MKINKLLLINIILFITVLVIAVVIGLVVISSLSSHSSVSAQTDTEDPNKDTTPPMVFNIKLSNLTSTSTLISWETDEDTDSLINYGLNKNYGVVREPYFDKQEHTLMLDELLPDMTYYYRITSTDSSGNQGISNDFTFTTPKEKEDVKKEGLGTEGVEGDGKTGDGQSLVEQAKEIIKKITKEQDLMILQAQLEDTAEETVKPPTIMLDVAKIEVGTDYAKISWETDKESSSMVSLAAERDYREGAENPYTWSEGRPEEYVLNHEVTINGLSPATSYHFIVYSRSELGLEGRSKDNVFKTKSILPVIEDINLAKIEEEAVTITFSTNVPCSAFIEYTNLDSGETKIEGNSSYLTSHNIKLNNLKYDTYYSAQIKVESEQGEKAQSDILTFITTKDEQPPVVSKVNTESTLYPGSENKVQTIISWETDEPSICQLFYHQGLIAGDTNESLLPEQDLGLKHVQVATNFLPSTVYKFWVICEDDVKNQVKSSSFTLLTPSQEESIIDLIIKNFEGTFGWMKKMTN